MHRTLGEKADGYLSLCPQDGPEFEQYKTDMATELLQSAAQALALIREQQQKGETYVYCLDRNLPGDDKGPFHAADLWYVFRTLLRSWRPWEAEDHMLAYALQYLLGEFRKVRHAEWRSQAGAARVDAVYGGAPTDDAPGRYL